MNDKWEIIDRLKVNHIVHLNENQTEQGAVIRKMMLERAEAIDLIQDQVNEIEILKENCARLNDENELLSARLNTACAEIIALRKDKSYTLPNLEQK